MDLGHLNGLPSELAGVIVSHLERESDLLSLALTCSFFCAEIVPRHLFYRTIRCTPLEGYRLWKVLAQDVILAKNVRRVELVETYDPQTGYLHNTQRLRRPIVAQYMGVEVTYPDQSEIKTVPRVFVKGPLFEKLYVVEDNEDDDDGDHDENEIEGEVMMMRRSHATSKDLHVPRCLMMVFQHLWLTDANWPL